MNKQIPASHFILTINANIDNKNLSDKDFREFIRNTLPIIKEVVELGKKDDE